MTHNSVLLVYLKGGVEVEEEDLSHLSSLLLQGMSFADSSLSLVPLLHFSLDQQPTKAKDQRIQTNTAARRPREDTKDS